MVDLEPFKEVMRQNIKYIVLLGAILIGGSLLFKKLGEMLKRRHKK